MAASISTVARIWVTAPEQYEGEIARARRRNRITGNRQHAGEEQERERKAVEEPHLARADGAEARRQAALHGVAGGLAGGGQECGRNPEKGEAQLIIPTALSDHAGTLFAPNHGHDR